MINSLVEFIRRCETATNNEIYEMFEFKTSDEVREEVLCFAEYRSPEPFRSAMYNIGFINY